MKTKRHRRKHYSAIAMDQFDQAEACCHNIATTALLLEACGHRKNDELNSEMVANTGTMIYHETIRLRTAVAELQKNLRTT